MTTDWVCLTCWASDRTETDEPPVCKRRVEAHRIEGARPVDMAHRYTETPMRRADDPKVQRLLGRR